MSLVLSRRSGEAVIIDGLTVEIQIVRGNRVRMIFTDPPGRTPPKIVRREVLDSQPAPVADACCDVDPHGHGQE